MDSGDEGDETDQEQEGLQVAEEEQQQAETQEGVIATLSGIPRFHTFRVRGVLQGQRCTVLIDGGATHNFIDRTLVERRGLPTKKLEGFIVVVAGGGRMECTRWIPKLNITLGNYNLTNDFFVVDVPDTNVVLGVQWLYSIGKYSTDYRTMEMEFQGPDGRRVVLRGMKTYPAKVVSSQRMEAVLRH